MLRQALRGGGRAVPAGQGLQGCQNRDIAAGIFSLAQGFGNQRFGGTQVWVNLLARAIQHQARVIAGGAQLGACGFGQRGQRVALSAMDPACRSMGMPGQLRAV